MKKPKIAIFASGRGSNLKSIIEAIKSGELNAEIVFVLSNNSNSGALAIAKENNIEAIHLSEKVYPGESYIASLIELLNKYKPDFIILAGYMKKIPEEVINLYPKNIINIHPALLPKYGGEGMYGMNVHNAVFNNGEKESGITIHYVNANYDEGEIIYQEKIDISDCNNPEEIAEKVLKLEHNLYPKIINKVINYYD